MIGCHSSLPSAFFFCNCCVTVFMYPFKNTFQSCTLYNKNLLRYHAVKLLNVILVGSEAAQYGLGYFVLVATHAKRKEERDARIDEREREREREREGEGMKRRKGVRKGDDD